MFANAQASIVQDLELVAEERRRRLAEPGLHAAVVAVKAYQQRRFMHTYADLLPSTRYGAAAKDVMGFAGNIIHMMIAEVETR